MSSLMIRWPAASHAADSVDFPEPLGPKTRTVPRPTDSAAACSTKCPTDTSSQMQKAPKAPRKLSGCF